MPAQKGDQAGDGLYDLPLADFTQARDELARGLRKEGKRDEADAVKSLRKPTAAAWALNQLARRRPKDIERLLSAGERLRQAHEELLAGGDRSALEAATAKERDLVDVLARDATTIASEAGTASTATLDEHVRNTLHAAALDEETAAELRAGRLVRERAAVGSFGAAMPVPATTTKARTADKRRGGTASRDAAKRQEADRELARAATEEQKAKREHARAEKAVERARRQADEAHKRAEGARATLREAERVEKEAARARERAARAVATAEKKLR